MPSTPVQRLYDFGQSNYVPRRVVRKIRSRKRAKPRLARLLLLVIPEEANGEAPRGWEPVRKIGEKGGAARSAGSRHPCNGANPRGSSGRRGSPRKRPCTDPSRLRVSSFRVRFRTRVFEFERLCRFDPVSSLAFGPGGPPGTGVAES